MNSRPLTRRSSGPTLLRYYFLSSSMRNKKDTSEERRRVKGAGARERGKEREERETRRAKEMTLTRVSFWRTSESTRFQHHHQRQSTITTFSNTVERSAAIYLPSLRSFVPYKFTRSHALHPASLSLSLFLSRLHLAFPTASVRSDKCSTFTHIYARGACVCACMCV